MPDETRKVYSVTELTRLVKMTLENNVGEVCLEGEISNVRRPASGHYYFTMKDETAQISAVLFRGAQRFMKFELADGLLVRTLGEVTVYEQRGVYQIIVRKIEEAGRGSLQAQFEKLKETLRKEGLFDASIKKPLPMLPRHIGIVTSPTGAAIRDILNIITRRFPDIHIVIAPAKVQGDAAAKEIAAAIACLNERKDLDVMIIARGGGSLEDLWCFNEEVVARAIARSRLPIISAVGHETDFTISDFVADLRAPTPSAAAELVVDNRTAFESMLNELARRMAHGLEEVILRVRHRLLAAEKSYVFAEPANLVKQYQERLNSVMVRLARVAESGVRRVQQRLDELSPRLLHEIQMRQEACRAQLLRLSTVLTALDPLAVLKRGYSVTYDAQGRVVVSAKQLSVGHRLRTRLLEGQVTSEVVETDKQAR